MTNIIDHFEYGTWEIQKNHRDTIKRIGFRYGHLALLRTDFLCQDCDKTHECWSVANLASGAYMFPGAVFHNVDDGTKYIYEISPLAKWDIASTDDIRKNAEALIKKCLDNNGIPLTVLNLLEGHTDTLDDVVPGTIAGLNGYTKQ